MNTRLQVEHPVTELITGIDLVEQMIRVAAGEKLKIKQADVKLNGWAVESPRLCRGPLPQLPALHRSPDPLPAARRRAPRYGGTVRNDTGVFEGAEISMYYDPMIAKLVTHAATREAAIDLQADALDAFVIDGVEHNIPVPGRPHAAPALARGPALHRLHRRGVQGRLQAARAAGRGAAAAGRGRHRRRPPDQRAPAPDHRPDGRPVRALRQPPHRHGRHRARRGAGGGNAAARRSR